MRSSKELAAPKPEEFRPKQTPPIMGVRIRTLKPIPDERGQLMELLRSDWPEFKKFGQVYMTTAYPGVVKGWHYHKRQVDHFICIRGMIKLALYDARSNSKTFRVLNELFLGDHHPIMVEVPPLVYHGFKCIGTEECLVINVPTEPYHYENPDEYRLPAHTPKIPYDWARRDG